LVWIASYPKSGNTWMRVLISNLRTPGSQPSNLNRLDDNAELASSRFLFDRITLLESGLLRPCEIDALRPAVHQARAAELARECEGTPAKDGALPRFSKCHDAYARLRNGTALLGGAQASSGAIVVVRDPRDVVPSLAHHSGRPIDAVIDSLNDPGAQLSRTRRGQEPQLHQRLLDWSGHVDSWLKQCDIPVHLVRYEDLTLSTPRTLLHAMQFAGWTISRAEAEAAARASSFDVLKEQEDRDGFSEGRRGASFFRRGTVGNWCTELTMQQVRQIEAMHGEMMTRLGYALST
jgi:hypothetical protein